MIYLDNAATTPISKTALDRLLQVNQEVFGNPSSIHAHGRKAAQVLRQARQAIAELLETQPSRIYFTSGGSEANNLAIKGYALANQDKGKHLITTALEHHSVLHVMDYLSQHWGFEVTYLQPIDGKITAKQLSEALREDTLLVSVMHTNNETGLQLPIEAMGRILAEHQAVFHVDAVQAVGKVPLSPEKLGIDLLSAAGHKCHGPKGTGFLYSSNRHFHPLIHGGSQEDKKRAGTENLAAIAAMAAALTDSLSHWEEHLSKVKQLKNQLLEELKTLDVYSNSYPEDLPYVLNIGFPGCSNELLLTQLDLAGISVSTGSACTAGTIEPSHVLAALHGADSPRLKESIRLSFSKMTQPQDIQIFIKTIKTILGD